MRLIDADALIEKRWQVKNVINQPDLYVIGQGYIMDAPTIDINNHAFWEIGGKNMNEHYCVNCGFVPRKNKLFEDIDFYNYCPNCGFKMDYCIE